MIVNVYVTDQNGDPVNNASVLFTQGWGDLVGGHTDANGFFSGDVVPIFDAAIWVVVDHINATGQYQTYWYGETEIYATINIYVETPYDITVNAHTGGTTNPVPGHYTGMGIIYVTAVPSSGYVFDHWEKNGAYLTDEVTFHTGDTGTFDAYFQAEGGGGGGDDSNAKITAIRVHDNDRNITYSWDNGVWDSFPQVAAGSGNLYIAFWAVNNGTTTTTITLQLKTNTGTVLKTVSGSAAPGAGIGLEWNGDMNSTFAVICTSTP